MNTTDTFQKFPKNYKAKYELDIPENWCTKRAMKQRYKQQRQVKRGWEGE